MKHMLSLILHTLHIKLDNFFLLPGKNERNHCNYVQKTAYYDLLKFLI